MKKEDVRSEGERPTVYRRRFLGTLRPVCPRPISLSPSPVTVPVMVSWHWTRPHVSFGFRFTSSAGPPHVVIRSTCHFLFLGSPSFRSSGHLLPTLSSPPHSNTHSPL